MNGFTKRVISALMTVSSVIAPVGQAIGFRAAAVGTAATMAPMLAHAQSGHRLCAVIMEADNDHFAGVMLEVNKADFLTCTYFIAGATGSWGAPTTLVGAINHVINDWRHGFPSPPTVARMATCEDVTRWWFPPGAYGGDVCNWMPEYKLHRFFRLRNGAFWINR